MKNILLLLVLLGGTLWQPLYAQGNRISGKVTDAATGEGIPGANVQIKGTTTGTATDMDGNYSLTASSSDVLLFTFVGYLQQEVTVGNQSTINVQLAEDVQQPTPEQKTVRSLAISMLARMFTEDDWQVLAQTAAEETAKGILQVRQREAVQPVMV